MQHIDSNKLGKSTFNNNRIAIVNNMELEMVKSKLKRKDRKQKKGKTEKNTQPSESEGNVNLAPEENSQVKKLKSQTIECQKSDSQILQNDNFLEEEIQVPKTKSNEEEPELICDSLGSKLNTNSESALNTESNPSLEGETTLKLLLAPSDDHELNCTDSIENLPKELHSKIPSETTCTDIPQIITPSVESISEEKEKPSQDSQGCLNAEALNELTTSSACDTIVDRTSQEVDILRAPYVVDIINENKPMELKHNDTNIEAKYNKEYELASIQAIEYKLPEIATKNKSDPELLEKVSPTEQNNPNICPEPLKIPYGFKENLIQEKNTSNLLLIGAQTFPKPSAPFMMDSDSEQDTFRKLQADVKITSKVTSFEKLPEIKPFITEYKIQYFPEITPSKNTNTAEKVPLKVNWNDLTLKFDLDLIDNLDDECLTNIEYYNMILREDLLPPRSTTNSANCSNEIKTVSAINCENLRTTSDSMKNLYSDASLLRRSELSPYSYSNPDNPYGQSSQNYDCSFYPADLESYALRERCEHYKKEHMDLLTPEIKDKSSKAKVPSPLSLLRDKSKQIFSKAKNVLKAAFTFNSSKNPQDGGCLITPAPRRRGPLEIYSGTQDCNKPRTTSPPRKRAFSRKQSDQRKSQRNFSKSLYAPDDGQESSSAVELKNKPCYSNSAAVPGVIKKESKTENSDWANSYYENLSLDSIEEIELFFQSLELEEQEQMRQRNKNSA